MLYRVVYVLGCTGRSELIGVYGDKTGLLHPLGSFNPLCPL